MQAVFKDRGFVLPDRRPCHAPFENGKKSRQRYHERERNQPTSVLGKPQHRGQRPRSDWVKRCGGASTPRLSVFTTSSERRFFTSSLRITTFAGRV